MKELKPCPFCGGEPVYTDNYYNDGTGHCVYCENCGCGTGILTGSSPIRTLKEMVYNAWNRRTNCPECIKKD